jgi:hypothetical protein
MLRRDPSAEREARIHPLRRHVTAFAQRLHAAEGRRLCPTRVVFLHLPKTAGSSVNAYFKARLGGSWRGQALTVTDAALARPGMARLAAGARFVGGHFGAGALEAVGPDAFRFTVLRDPLERLASAWRFFQSHRRRELHMPFDRIEAALASDHPRVVAALDNVMARQLSGGASGSGDAAVVAAAAETLRGLDRVAWQGSFDADFAEILAALGLPPAPAPLRANVTLDPDRRGRDPSRPLPPLPPRDELGEMAAPWIRLDRAVVEEWRQRATATGTGRTDAPPPRGA